MTDQELERRLRSWYRAEVSEAERAPAALRTRVAAIPHAQTTPERPMPWRFWTVSAATRLIAAAVIGALALGGAFYVIQRNQPAIGGPSPTPSATPSPSESARPSAGPTSSVVPARAPSWTVTGSMTTPRMGHAATLLRDGRVLVAGGINKSCFCSDLVAYGSAELYDPTTGSWTATGSMLTHAGGAALTLLLNGKVLAAGGGTAELYDPSTGIWTATGNMVTSDSTPNATLLADGRVLVLGGTHNGVMVDASAQLYDPFSGTWAPAANMTRPRFDPTATLLADGKVLVAGGDGNPGPTPEPGPLGPDSAELYDPVTGSWTATGSMVATAGVNHATPLPDGKVLVFGYSTNARNFGALSEELYDPSSGTWSLTGKMIGQDFGYQPTLLRNGKVLVTAGSAAQLYDPASGTWTVTVSLVTPRFSETVTLLSDGRVLVAGGGAGAASGSTREAVASAELYDPGSGIP